MSPITTKPLSVIPLVSVILTSYNYEQFVGEAIQSVYAQSYQNLELIIVDDGSTDNSREVISKVVENSTIPTKLIFKQNGGQASAFNAGFKQVKGDVVCFIDSDDLWYEQKIEKMIHFMQSFPDGGVYQHHLDNTKGKLKKNILISGDVFQEWKALKYVDVIKRTDLVAIFLPTSGLSWYKKILDKVFPVPEELVTCPDAYLTRSSCCFGPLYSFPEILGSWREHGQNAGKEKFLFKKYWIPIVLPTINGFFLQNNIPIKFIIASDPAINTRVYHSIATLCKKAMELKRNMKLFINSNK
jgi:glycosyltransferase involved in cell wall biosynthesis